MAFVQSADARSAIFFVHIGPAVPTFALLAMAQTVLFSTLPVYLIADASALSRLSLPLGSRGLARESLNLAPPRTIFRRNAKLRPKKSDLWIASIERFFYLEAAMRSLGLENCLHLETDVMLYRDAAGLVGTLARYYPGMGVPFIDNTRAIASIVFIRKVSALARLCQYFADSVDRRPGSGLNEMLLLRSAHEGLGADVVDALPILPENNNQAFVNLRGEAAIEPAIYSRHASELGCIFDAAAIGQYLGGTDRRVRRRKWLFFDQPANPPNPGFVNEESFIDPRTAPVSWSIDDSGRRVPSITEGGAAIPLANLHLHSKDLAPFRSDAHPSQATTRG